MATHVYTDKVSAKIVRLVKNNLMIADKMTKKFEMEFEDKAEPIGQTLRVKKPLRGAVVDGSLWTGANIERKWATVGPFQHFHIPLQAGVGEQMFEMERTDEAREKNLFAPLAAQLAQEIDLRAARFIALNTTMHVGVLGTTPTSFDTFGSATTRIDEKDGKNGKLRAGMYISPESHRSMVSGTPNAINLFNAANGERIFTEGVIGRYSGYDIGTTMSLYSHTTGVIATVASITVSVSSVDGDTSIVLGCATGDTIKAGDYITVANCEDVNPFTRASLFRRRHLTVAGDPGQTYTAAANVVTVPLVEPLFGPGNPYQNISRLPVALDAVTFNDGYTMTDATAKSGKMGVTFTNDAFAIVGAKVPSPKKGSFETVSSYIDPDTGINIAILGWYVPETLEWRWRADCCIGFGKLLGDTSSAVTAIGA
jgi:hypothetical protein